MADRSRWWRRNRGLPEEAYASWAASVSAQPGRQVRILAWAEAVPGFGIASPSLLSWGEAAGWAHVGWHEIETGGWDRDTGRLSWTRYGGDRGSVELAEPGRLPEVFRERVSASIVLEKFVPIVQNRGVLISGRRDLADRAAGITWNSSLGRGLSWDVPGVQEAADAAVAQVRTEYDMG